MSSFLQRSSTGTLLMEKDLRRHSLPLETLSSPFIVKLETEMMHPFYILLYQILGKDCFHIWLNNTHEVT